MKVNEIKPKEGSTKKRKRVGRGNASGWGGEAGRGHKGQKSRSGYSRKPGFEGGQNPLYKRIPKKNGFKNPFKTRYQIVNLQSISDISSENDLIDIDFFVTKMNLSSIAPVKILANGVLDKPLSIKAHAISKTALDKLNAAGGSFETVSY